MESHREWTDRVSTNRVHNTTSHTGIVPAHAANYMCTDLYLLPLEAKSTQEDTHCHVGKGNFSKYGLTSGPFQFSVVATIIQRGQDFGTCIHYSVVMGSKVEFALHTMHAVTFSQTLD